MKKLFSTILVLGLLLSGNGYAETTEQRLEAIEKRLERIESLLNPLMSLKENNNPSDVTTKKEEQEELNKCIKIEDINTSIITDERTNEFYPYVEYSYKISYSNSCDKDIYGTPTFSFLDKDGLILHKAMIYKPVLIPAKGSYEAKGTEMLSSKQKINRLHSSSAGLNNLGFY
ncbi:hypothetical protein N8129_04290 [Pelagibacteraceae bacterium]|nr:hypothetical protein [Candidatus Pelagibacter sp.]MDC1491304.1 hypothetical protein [Pelagibacteraceae bacterium]